MTTLYAPPGVTSIPSPTTGVLYRADPTTGAINASSADVGALTQAGFTFSPSPAYSPPMITGGSVSNTTNLAATQLYKLRAALARQATGGAFVKVALIGDSTTAGAISDPTLTNYRPFSWGAKLATMLTAAGVPACMTNAIGNAQGAAGSGSSFGTWDGRLTSVGSVVCTPNTMIGGVSCGLFTGQTQSFAPGVSTDTVDLYFVDQVGTFTVNIDGGASLGTTTMTNSGLPRKVTVSYTAGVHTINVVWASGPALFNFLGFDAYTAASPQVHLLNLGSGGAQVQTLAANVNPYDPIPWTKFIAPDLSIISLGINDWIAGTTQPNYVGPLQVIVNACLLSGDVILMTPFPSDAGQAPLATQAQFVASMRSLAQSNGLQLIDENYNLVSKAVMTARGLGSDVNHPNGLGHSVIARDIKTSLMQFI